MKGGVLSARSPKGGLLCLLLSLVYFTSYMTRLNFSAVTAELTGQAILTKTQAGAVLTALSVAYGLGQILSGLLGDRCRPERMITVGFLMSITCNILMPILPGAVSMTVLWAINGLAQAMFWPPIVLLMVRSYDEAGYARCNWFVIAASQLATVLVYVAVAACVRFLDWRSVFFGAGILAAVALVVFRLGFAAFRRGEVPATGIAAPVPEGPESAAESRESDEREGKKPQILSLFVATGTLYILFAIVCQGFLRDGVQNWMPNIFAEALGLSTETAILSNAVLPVFNVIMVSVATVLYRRVFHNEVREALVLFGVVAAVSLLLAVFLESSAMLSLVLAAVITGSAHSINTCLISFVPRRFAGCGRAATVSGILNACTYVGAAVASYVIALISERAGWLAAILCWCGVALAGALVCLLAYRRWSRFIRAAEPESE